MKPFSLLIKPTGPDCNIACKYCFYTGKTEMFGTHKHRMSDEVMERMVSDFMGLGFPVSSFAWQGGEPTLMGLDFYKRVVETQQRCGADGQVVSNALQTNGILLDDEWAAFLKQYSWLVGISLDGPKYLHDHYRKDRGGNGTYDRVIAGIEACRRARVDFNILVLLNNLNVEKPDELFDFFVNEKHIRFLQFVPCVEPGGEKGRLTDFSTSAGQYGRFICRIFDRWLDYGPTKLSIRLFDSLLNYIVNGQHTNCTFNRSCSDYMVVEHNGDAFCCDFFVEEGCRMGNIMETHIGELITGEVKRKFARAKNTSCTKCMLCRWRKCCYGGCLKDRYSAWGNFEDATPLCEGYKMIFDYTMPKLANLAAKLAAGELR
jgi:uncharacterized protein